MKTPFFLAVGWDKKLHVWVDPAKQDDDDQGGGGEDEAEDKPVDCKDLPPGKWEHNPDHHNHDIMSCTFDLKHMLIFTGGVDGTLIGWNSETWFPRY